MTNERKMSRGLQAILFMGATGLMLIGAGEVISNVPSKNKIIEQVEYTAKFPGYLALGFSTLLGVTTLAVVGGKKLHELYNIGREFRND